jgi:hypothetical protein
MPAKKAAKTTAKKAAKTKAPESSGTSADPALNSAPAKAPRKTAKKAAKKGPTTDDIAKSAYLNYRRRVENNLPGDHENDWLEAEKQLNA